MLDRDLSLKTQFRDSYCNENKIEIINEKFHSPIDAFIHLKYVGILFIALKYNYLLQKYNQF
jgi:hypothetical protein